MRMVIVDKGNSRSEQQYQQLAQQVQQKQIDLVLFVGVEQHQQSFRAGVALDHYLLADGITRLYQDNGAYQCQRFFEKAWSGVFWTTCLYAQYHVGQALLCRPAIVRIWYRALGPQVKLVVIELVHQVFAIIATAKPEQMHQKYLRGALDLLRAQVKPVILVYPNQLRLCIPNGYWQMLRLTSQPGWERELAVLVDFTSKELRWKRWHDSWPIILIEIEH
ncbi:hypothetical protein JOC36_000422 [Weissella uvarum]|uniref:hypothetical protein n=1 Tax=Weissella uvarum TaxID=1479233 RepID=UPI001961A2E4|nr:hypothetical protein [Weissella uvarum]MBM7616889.1 hypothetical protein [Weissella uvarum]MCM0594659.1 hypothetical protein [Weissella uvarum]